MINEFIGWFRFNILREKYSVSSGIDGSLTYGYGKLDDYGYWQYPIYIKEGE